jgi:hypothetical protein
MNYKTKLKSQELVGCKCYRPGDPEFDTIASLITPLHKIRSEVSNHRILYPLDEKSDFRWRRNESVNDLFSGDHYVTI